MFAFDSKARSSAPTRSAADTARELVAPVQRKAAPGARVDGDAASDTGIAPRDGQALPAEQRAHFEARLGSDFSGVRVHADGQAANAARGQGALAYTIGRDIVFAAGEYAPATPRGTRLLAHELVHVAQQQLPGGGPPAASHESEADELADRVADARPARAPVRAVAAAPQFKPAAYPKTVTIGGASVTVASQAEETEATKLIDNIKFRFGVSFDSQKGLKELEASVVGDPDDTQTMQDALLNAPRKKVKDVLATSNWSLSQLRDLVQGLSFFQPVLGPLAPMGGGGRLTTLSRLKVGLNDTRDATDKKVLGQYFATQGTAAIYDSAGSSTELADTKKATQGVVVHEAAHAILGGNKTLFVSRLSPAYWKDENTPTGDAAAEQPITSYGAKNAGEDLADAAMFYFLERKTLQAKCPQRDAVIDALVKAWQPPGPTP